MAKTGPLVREREYRSVGRDFGRVDGREKLTGEAKFGTDVDREGLLHAAVLRSNLPHAEVTDVDTAAAVAIDGVKKVVTRSELMGMFDERVRHYGDVIAAVAATDFQTAQEAVRSLEYELEPLEAVYDAREAVKADAQIIHENNPDHKQVTRHPFEVDNPEYVNNVDDYHVESTGDLEAAFEDADFVFEETYQSPRVAHCNLDSHCCVAEWEGDTLVLEETLGAPGRGQAEMAEFLGLEHDQVIVRTPPTASSSFGARSVRKPSLEPVAATLARETGQPVKLWFDREEEFTAADTRHRTYYTFTTGVTADGNIVGVRQDVVADTGAEPNGIGHIVLNNSRDRLLELYKIPNYEYEGVSVYTNNVPAGEYRGVGSTQMLFAFESHLDELAYQMGIDPFELRRRNFVESGYPRPHTGVPIESCAVEACMERGWDRFDDLRRGSEETDEFVRAWGFAAGTHNTGSNAFGDEDSSTVRLVLTERGVVETYTAAIDHGQGADTVIAQIISEETGIPLAAIGKVRSAADFKEDVLGSIASRTTYIIGQTTQKAARRLDRALRQRVAEEFDVDDEAVSVEEGRISAPGIEPRSIAEFVASTGEEIEVVARAGSAHTPPTYGVHYAEVEIDKRTGHADITTYVAAQDIGFAIHPKMLEGQIEGAVLHSIEFALYSELKLDNGTPVNPNIADYPAISPLEMPDEMACVLIESNEESGPYGAKGIGTPAMPPIAPAILNAVRKATGVRFHAAPVESEAIYDAVNGGEHHGVE